MNEIEQVVKALDTLETLKEFDDNEMIVNEDWNKVFIIDTDVNNMKNFLTKALEQLNNLDIEVRKEE